MDPGLASDDPDGTPQVDQDDSIDLEGRQVGDLEHALGEQGRGSRTGTNVVPRYNSSSYTAPRADCPSSISLYALRGHLSPKRHVQYIAKSYLGCL